MTHIFISYSRKDSDIMQRVHSGIAAAGLEVWTDEKLTPGTQSWKNAIERAIEEAACLVVLLSPDSKQSDSVEREIEYAGMHDLAVLPILIRGDKRASVPLELATTQWLDLRTDFDAGMQELLAALRSHLGLMAPTVTSSDEEQTELSAKASELKQQFAKAVEESKWNAVIELGAHLLEELPDDMDVRLTLARVYWQYGGSLQIEDGAFEDNPYKQTMALFYFDKAIMLDPDQADYYFSRGMLHKRMGDFEAAIADFQRAAKMGHARASSQLSRSKR
jgi:tetratricopeptide (TPR) repeat protein